MSSKELNFDNDPTVREKPVTLKGTKYTIREASEDTTIKFRGMQLTDAQIVDGKVTAKISKVYQSQSYLVSECMFLDGSTKPVGMDFIKGLPSRIVKELFSEVKSMSNLDETESAEELQKKIEEDTKRLEKMRSEGSLGKDSQPTTGTTTE